MRGELTELLVIPAAGPSSAESLERESRMKLQTSNQDGINKGETFRTETQDAVQLGTEAPGGCANSRTSRQNSPDPEGQKAERAIKTRARAKFKGLEVSAGCSHQVSKKRGHDLAKNAPPRGEGRTEAGLELDSSMYTCSLNSNDCSFQPWYIDSVFWLVVKRVCIIFVGLKIVSNI